MRTIEIKDRSVVLQANSLGRPARGRALLEPLLDGLVDAPQITAQTLDGLKALHRAEETDAPSEPPTEDQQAILSDWIDRHYRSVLDASVPMLGGAIPRPFAHTAEGRPQLAA